MFWFLLGWLLRFNFSHLYLQGYLILVDLLPRNYGILGCISYPRVPYWPLADGAKFVFVLFMFFFHIMLRSWGLQFLLFLVIFPSYLILSISHWFWCWCLLFLNGSPVLIIQFLKVLVPSFLELNLFVSLVHCPFHLYYLLNSQFQLFF